MFFVTGRTEQKYFKEWPSYWTLRNLKAAGYIDVEWTICGLAPDHGVADYKTQKRHREAGLQRHRQHWREIDLEGGCAE